MLVNWVVRRGRDVSLALYLIMTLPGLLRMAACGNSCHVLDHNMPRAVMASSCASGKGLAVYRAHETVERFPTDSSPGRHGRRNRPWSSRCSPRRQLGGARPPGRRPGGRGHRGGNAYDRRANPCPPCHIGDKVQLEYLCV